MKLILIAAVADNGVIGAAGDLPWRLPEDLRRFKRLTLGHVVLMGRKTWESLGRPLPQRDNWVLTRDPAYAPAGARVFARLEEALTAAGTEPIYIIGGGDLYRQALPLADTIELTRVKAEPAGDTYFPAIDPALWQETAREDHAADDRHASAYSFVTLKRRG